VTFSFANAMVKMEEETSTEINTRECCHHKGTPHEESEDQLLKQQAMVERQQQDIKVMSQYLPKGEVFLPLHKMLNSDK
jgi:kinesin family protein C2/C3